MARTALLTVVRCSALLVSRAKCLGPYRPLGLETVPVTATTESNFLACSVRTGVYRQRENDRAGRRRRVRRQARGRQAGSHRRKVLRLPQRNARILLLRQVRVCGIQTW